MRLAIDLNLFVGLSFGCSSVSDRVEALLVGEKRFVNVADKVYVIEATRLNY